MKNVGIPLKLISLLADGEFHSGAKLSALFGMSFAEINKYIQTVREWGVEVLTITVPKTGYRLHEPLQLLDETAIWARLPYGRLVVISVINSTNQYLIDRIGILEPGDVCTAEYQTQGRGRRGRKWLSPFGKNIYLSIYWRFEQGQSATSGLSIMVGIVIAEMLQRLGFEGVRVKWPNDIYLNNSKLAGILLEITGQVGNVIHFVIGVGMNLNMPGSASDMIDQDWINLQEVGITIDRNALVAELINTLRQTLQQFERDGFAPFVNRWQSLDNFYNCPVKLIIGNQEIRGISSGINTNGALLLEQDGEYHAYSDGDISLRLAS
ncbi:Bifunctional protein BirA [Candidatus Moranella endobia PCVAL]|nr:bifunctional biotin--[acetyl-CoA-carboxylase] ligase/biotin operon repressor BirA [Candidatus Moranella endobia]AGJ61244.1 Bifunctional protein BirA [Candidatus Moranella endobia PCVAL]